MSSPDKINKEVLRNHICILDVTIQISILQGKRIEIIDMMKRDLEHFINLFKRMGGC